MKHLHKLVQCSRFYLVNGEKYLYLMGSGEQERTSSSLFVETLHLVAQPVGLREYWRYQLTRYARSSQWQDKDLVFATDDGGFVQPQHLYEYFKALVKKVGLPDMRFHDLRHSAISIWLAMGINPKVVQELAGHSDIRVTLNVYGHVFPGMHGRAMDEFDRYFRKTDDE